jgi:hypothetical protein
MARYAYENCIRWTMAYCAANPYDMTVPRPLNAPSAMDLPMFAYDLFQDDGMARTQRAFYAKGGVYREARFHPIMWGDPRARFSMRSAGVIGLASLGEWAGVQAGSPNSNAAEKAYPLQPGSLWGGMEERYDILRVFRPRADGYHSVGRSADPVVRQPIGYPSSMVNNTQGTYWHRLSLFHGWLHRYEGGAGSYASPTNHEMKYADATTAPFVHRLPIMATMSDWSAMRTPGSPRVWDIPGDGSLTASALKAGGAVDSRWWYSRRFAPADRCRQLVFWSVDWRSYADAESAPASPVNVPLYGGGGWQYSSGEPQNSGAFQAETSVPQTRAAGWPYGGHPEEALAWSSVARDGTLARPNRTRMSGSIISISNYGDGWDITIPAEWEHARRNVWAASGQWGADRNGNGSFDKGPIEPTVRLRAVTVGRYPFYDPVMPTWVRR